MPNVYVVCGGTSAANGFYTDSLASYDNDKLNNYTLVYDSGYWNLKNDSNVVLYRLAAASSAVEPFSATGWEIVGGSSPTIKTFNSSDIATVDSNNNYVFGSVVVVGADQAAANGTYTRSENNIWINSAGWEIKPYTGSAYAAIYNNTNNPIYFLSGGSPANGGNYHPVNQDSLGNSVNGVVWSLTDYGATVAPSASYYVDTAVCSAGSSGGGNAGNNYTHSRIVDAITITGAGGSYTGANGTYYASRNWASGTSEANGDLPIFVHANGNYIIYYNTIGEWWQISDSLIGGALYVNGEYSTVIPAPVNWANEVAPSGNVSSTSSSVRRFFVRTSGNNAYLRHTS